MLQDLSVYNLKEEAKEKKMYTKVNIYIIILILRSQERSPGGELCFRVRILEEKGKQMSKKRQMKPYFFIQT